MMKILPLCRSVCLFILSYIGDSFQMNSFSLDNVHVR
jgi:hypothetical protein